jgi:S-formylglutathione hydrolase FrmB
MPSTAGLIAMAILVALAFGATPSAGQDTSVAPDASAASGSNQDAEFSPPSRDEQGVLHYKVSSPHQAGETELRVLRPDGAGDAPKGDTEDAVKRYPVVYVLPVERQGGVRYGNGLAEVLKRDLHNQHQVIFVAPSFSALPWYADHPSDATIRQEAYFVDVVVPFVEKSQPALAEPGGRLLLGFSKSGWGAWSLLLRHGDKFGRAAAWDAPLAMPTVGKYGSGEVFATQENFQRYRVSDLLHKQAEQLRSKPRLILAGYGNFRAEHQQTHELLTKLEIPHVYRDGPQRKHDWHSGWVAEAVELLLAEEPR